MIGEEQKGLFLAWWIYRLNWTFANPNQYNCDSCPLPDLCTSRPAHLNHCTNIGTNYQGQFTFWDWTSLRGGRGGGATKWENRGSETFCAPLKTG